MLLECIATSAFSSNFNLPKKFRTFDFRVWLLSLKIYNFISVSQAQIRVNVDKVNNVESFTQLITVSFQYRNYYWGVKLPERFWQNNFNVTYYKQNVGTNNESCCFNQNITVNSITSNTNFNKHWLTFFQVNY